MKISSIIPLIPCLIFITVLFGCEKKYFHDEEKFPFDLIEDTLVVIDNLTISVRKSNVENYINDVYIFDTLKSAVVTNKGFIEVTINGGYTWDKKLQSDIPLFSIDFGNNDIGYVVGGSLSCNNTGCTPPGSKILKTEDGGNSWTIAFETKDVLMNCVDFIDELNGFVLGWTTIKNPFQRIGLIYNTSNGGKNWKIIDTINNCQALKKIEFINEDLGFIYGIHDYYPESYPKFILSTNDGGNIWTEIFQKEDIYSIQLIDKDHGYYIENGIVFKTEDGAQSWTQLNNNPENINQLLFVDKDIGFAFGCYCINCGCFGCSCTSSIFVTHNGGNTWNGKMGLTKFPSQIVRAKFFSTNGIIYSMTRILEINIHGK
ncbi:MAG: hypothetical protein KAX05_11075 [Bacteroidales bacterium]|nr:hypothetical protein [Bacteroidales bacterium]